MSKVLLQIDGKEVKATKGMTVLEAAQSAGISIPTLCHHEKLNPYGACRICTVEVEAGGRTNLVAACIYPVAPDLVVKTQSEAVHNTRKTLLELMLAHAPDASALQNLAKEYGLLVTGGSDCHGLAKSGTLMGDVKIPYELVKRLKKVMSSVLSNQ